MRFKCPQIYDLLRKGHDDANIHSSCVFLNIFCQVVMVHTDSVEK